MRANPPPKPLWTPFPGPQTEAYLSQAHELFYGGAAGGGKTALLIGLSITAHHRSLILRRVAVNVVEVVEQIKRFAGTTGWRGSGHGGTMTTTDNRIVEIGGCEHEDDKEKYQGRPHDLLGLDEVSHFTRSQFRFISAWNRTTLSNQRCRVILTGNPPTTPEGRWIVEEFAPWLDSEYPEPAQPGELRWYTVLDDKLKWLPNGDSFEYKGETIHPRSRTFIPALLKDNPILSATDYGARLQALDEPLRSQLLYGDMTAGLDDNAWQVVPTAWVRAAMNRWKPEQPTEQEAMGVDVSRGGAAKTVLCSKHGQWFAKLIKIPGKQVPDGDAVASLVVQNHKGEAPVLVDVCGVGASAYDSLKKCSWFRTIPVNNANASNLRDRSGRIGFRNVRAASYWKFREALDPIHGDNLALPPDNELLADLCAPHYKILSGGYQIEKKEEVVERLGRSPDCGDAVVLAHWHSCLPRVQPMRTFSLGPMNGKKPTLKMVVCTQEELAALIIVEATLLIVFDEPEPAKEVMCNNGTVSLQPSRNELGLSLSDLRTDRESSRVNEGVGINGHGLGSSFTAPLPPVGHALEKLLEMVRVEFADIDPRDQQQHWTEPLLPWGKLPQDLIMQKEHGKRIWGALLRKRPDPALVWVFADTGGGKALSTAYTVCDVLRLPREATIYRPSEPESKHQGVASNKHIVDIIKASRSMVMT